MKVLTVLGARPQFIKAAAVSRILRQKHIEIMLHTGQHYDQNMSQVFFDELGIPAPDINLGIGSGSHGSQTGAMLAAIEEVIKAEIPDWVLVYGDTNSTLAGALASAKLNFPVAHVEAGLRSYNRRMPEEINRVLTDHLSSLLFCPSQNAVNNLEKEGITAGVHIIGDVMFEALSYARSRTSTRPDILFNLGLKEKKYLLVTVHRAENTDDPDRLRSILSALGQVEENIIFPVHPRTQAAIDKFELGSRLAHNIRLINPLGYLDMVRLQEGARIILTDSGGMQKEAYWLGVPCITLRDETEWVETVQAGWNILVGTDPKKIVPLIENYPRLGNHPNLYENSQGVENCLAILENLIAP